MSASSGRDWFTLVVAVSAFCLCLIAVSALHVLLDWELTHLDAVSACLVWVRLLLTDSPCDIAALLVLFAESTLL